MDDSKGQRSSSHGSQRTAGMGLHVDMTAWVF